MSSRAAAHTERFAVVCLACGAWRVHITVRAWRCADGSISVAPVLTCIVCHERHVFDERSERELVLTRP